MSKLSAIATGNFTSSSTWGLIDSTSFQGTIFTTTTTNSTYSQSTTFTPGAIVVDAIAVYLKGRVNNVSAGSDTFSIGLFQGGVLVSGTEVIMTITDLPLILIGDTAKIGWVVFKLTTPVTLSAATAYTVGVKTTNAALVSVYRDSTGSNWVKFVRTTTTQAPAVADDLYIIGDNSGSSVVVTMNNTATTIFGNIEIGLRGKLAFGVATSTDYYLKLAGNINIMVDGIFTIGTSGTPIPASSTAVLEFSISSANQYGVTLNGTSNFETCGANKKSWTLLTVDAASSATSFTCADTTGWVSGDEVGFGTVLRSTSSYDRKTLNTVPSGTTFTTTAGVSSAKAGTGALTTPVMNLTRNVKIRSTSTTNSFYIFNQETATLTLKDTQITYIGFGFSGTRSLQFAGTGTSLVDNCSFVDGGTAIQVNTVSVAGFTIQNCTFYNMTGYGFAAFGATVLNSYSVTGCCAIACDVGFAVSPAYLAFSNNRAVCCGSYGLNYYASSLVNLAGTSTGNIAHSCRYGMEIDTDLETGTISNVSLLNNTFYGLYYSSAAQRPAGLVFDGWTVFGNATTNIWIAPSAICLGLLILKNFVIDAGYNSILSPIGLTFGASGIGDVNKLMLIGCTFGANSTHSTGDFLAWNTGNHAIEAFNCSFASSTYISGLSSLGASGYIASQKHNQTAGSVKTVFSMGVITTDTSIYSGTSPSMRLTPSSASVKLVGGSFKVAVLSGQTATVTIKVRKSASGDGATYNGNFPRLLLKPSPAAGVVVNTVLATATSASAGAWQTLTGTTPTVTDDCVLEFAVDCDGTVGWVNVDEFAVTSTTYDTTGMKYWESGQPKALIGGAGVGGSVTNNIIVKTRRKVM